MKILIFTDIHGRKWICGESLRLMFGVTEPLNRRFWDYDLLCRWEANHHAG